MKIPCVITLFLFVFSSFGAFAASDKEWTRVHQILAAGGSVEVGDDFTPSQIRSLIYTGGERLIARCFRFEIFDCRSFVRVGSSAVLDGSYSPEDVRGIIRMSEPAQKIYVKARGFSDFDVRQFAKLGAIIR